MAHEVLVVDDEADIRFVISEILHDEGYQTRQAADTDAAIEAIQERQPNLVILDVWLEGSPIDGLELLKRIKQEHPDLPVVMISGHGTVEMAVEAIRCGAYDFIEKPFKTDRLLLVVQRSIEAALLRRENAELRLRTGHLSEVVGDSPAITTLRQAITRAAPTGSRILVTGAPGSGKDVVARAIHVQSRRQNGPFVTVTCATISPENFEIELFGAEQNSSGPMGPRKVGLLEQAHGGTLFLDEICDMPLETQAKILRVLQDQNFQRVGGGRRVEVDVRVIASTNRHPEEEVQSGRFRQDLYYRLNVVPLQVPPLRARRDDIPLLARHFLEHAAAASGLPRLMLGEDAAAALQAYDWPGNVRQLRNVIDWVMIMAPDLNDRTVHADALPPEIRNEAPGMLGLQKGEQMMGLPLREAREVFEREYLMTQITRFGGNVSRTATFVGMERSALHRKLKSLSVGIPSERN